MKILIDMNLLATRLIETIREHQAVIEKGALVTIDETKARIRILPF
jgi:hypothetical protein